MIQQARSVYDAGPTSAQDWANASCLLGGDKGDVYRVQLSARNSMAEDAGKTISQLRDVCSAISQVSQIVDNIDDAWHHFGSKLMVQILKKVF